MGIFPWNQRNTVKIKLDQLTSSDGLIPRRAWFLDITLESNQALSSAGTKFLVCDLDARPIVMVLLSCERVKERREWVSVLGNRSVTVTDGTVSSIRGQMQVWRSLTMFTSHDGKGWGRWRLNLAANFQLKQRADGSEGTIERQPELISRQSKQSLVRQGV